MLRVDGKALRLPIRPMRSADVRPLIPREPQPAQVVVNGRLRRAGRALDVRVLDAQDERPARSPGEQPVEQGRTRIAYVEVPGRAGGETDAQWRHGTCGDARVSARSGTQPHGR